MVDTPDAERQLDRPRPGKLRAHEATQLSNRVLKGSPLIPAHLKVGSSNMAALTCNAFSRPSDHPEGGRDAYDW